MGKLIIIEGIDGSGKTTVAKALCDSLGSDVQFISKKSIDADTLFRKEFMAMVKPILWEHSGTEPLHEIDEESWLFLHMLWYHMLQEYTLVPHLARFKYVVMDGWYYKFLARHIVNQKMETSLAKKLTSRLFTGDKVFMLNVPPEICYHRKGGAKSSEYGIHKDANTGRTFQAFCDYQSKVHDAYMNFENKKRFINIDANKSIQSVVDDVLRTVKEL
jgi:thymidylate kinase